MSTIAVITARGSSDGLPGKNLREFLGKPLINWTIEVALAAPSVDRVLVSTDDPGIAAVAHGAGAEVPFLRPAELATDTADPLDAVRHMIEWLEDRGDLIKRVVLLQPTSPLREVEDIEKCLARLSPDVDVCISVTDASKTHMFMIAPLPGGGFAPLVIKDQSTWRRQGAPHVYVLNGAVYCWWRHTLDAPRYGPRTQIHIMPQQRSVDIDTLADFELAAFYRRRSLSAADDSQTQGS